MNKQESQNQVSIIINGVMYDAVETDSPEFLCEGCDLFKDCKLASSCEELISLNRVFKKSDKKFEP